MGWRRTSRIRRRLALAACALCAAAMLAACSSGAGTASDSAATQSAAAATTVARTAIAAAATQTRFTYIPPRVTRGELAEFILLTAPDAACDITVTYASGPPNLDAPAPQTADRDGNLRFTWNVNKSAPVGQASAVVHCNNDTARATFVVT